MRREEKIRLDNTTRKWWKAHALSILAHYMQGLALGASVVNLKMYFFFNLAKAKIKIAPK